MTIEEEDALIDGFGNAEFAQVLFAEFGPVGSVRLMGWAAMYGLTGKHTTVEAREALVKLGVARVTVYAAYADFRRLRRALLAKRDVIANEQRGGPGANGGVPMVIERVRALQSL